MILRLKLNLSRTARPPILPGAGKPWTLYSGPETARCCFSLDSLLQRDLLTEALQWISPLYLFQLYRSVLVQKLVDAEIATADAYLDFILLNAYIYFFGAEGVSSA